MNGKTYLLISAAIFALIAILHIVRLVNRWSILIGSFTVPLWGSWLGFILAAALSVWAFRLMGKWSFRHH
ncbi:hypothetical protein [Altericista sp. CCNU0014]|uniref:hypothetical protein n=1 Tax=Altericista sp. CCNU0014 TaxID=3082949 RepID=UPI003850695C